jgi:hypothetical protein
MNFSGWNKGAGGPMLMVASLELGPGCALLSPIRHRCSQIETGNDKSRSVYQHVWRSLRDRSRETRRIGKRLWAAECSGLGEATDM